MQVEQRTLNSWVAGSSPALAIKVYKLRVNKKTLQKHLVTRRLATLGTKGISVAGEGMCGGQEPNPYPCDKVGKNP